MKAITTSLLLCILLYFVGCTGSSNKVPSGSAVVAGAKSSNPVEDIYINDKFLSSLKRLHSFSEARKETKTILLYFDSTNPRGFTGGNEALSFSDNDVEAIQRTKTADGILSIDKVGTFTILARQISDADISHLLVPFIFSYKKYQANGLELSVTNGECFINKTEYKLLVNLGFQFGKPDALVSDKSSYYFVITGRNLSLFRTNPDDYSLGNVGELVAELVGSNL